MPEALEDNIRQTTIVQEPLGDTIRQTEIVPEPERTTTKPRATKRQTRTVPGHIQRIAETRAQYDTLSLAEFSKLLFDRNIYRAKDRQTGREKPVNRGTLQKWLEEVREVGLL